MNKPQRKTRVVKITLELDPHTHAELGRIAKREARSKRKEAARVVTDYVRSRRGRSEAGQLQPA